MRASYRWRLAWGSRTFPLRCGLVSATRSEDVENTHSFSTERIYSVWLWFGSSGLYHYCWQDASIRPDTPSPTCPWGQVRSLARPSRNMERTFPFPLHLMSPCAYKCCCWGWVLTTYSLKPFRRCVRSFIKTRLTSCRWTLMTTGWTAKKSWCRCLCLVLHCFKKYALNWVPPCRWSACKCPHWPSPVHSKSKYPLCRELWTGLLQIRPFWLSKFTTVWADGWQGRTFQYVGDPR